MDVGEDVGLLVRPFILGAEVVGYFEGPPVGSPVGRLVVGRTVGCADGCSVG